MRGNVKRPARTSKKHARQLAGKYPPTGGSISAAMAKFKALFPQKPALELALRTGADLSHCERCLAGTRSLGPEYLTRLIQSDVGRDILIALMGDAKPAWWKGFRRHLDLSELVKAQARTQASIEKMQREMAE